MATRDPGLYTTHAATYRVQAVPGRAAMRVVERRDGRWRAVAALPAEALYVGASATPPEELVAFAGVPAPAEAVGMRDWLAFLEAQREALKRTVLGLVRDYDAERVFSVADVDRDHDVDLAESADAALPLLVAYEDAIDTVRRCVERPRGGAGLTVAADATAGRLLEEFDHRWGPVRLELFRPSDAYYREGLPDRPAPEEPLSRRSTGAARAVGLLGTMTPKQVRDTLYDAFGVEAEVHGPASDESLDAAASRLG